MSARVGGYAQDTPYVDASEVTNGSLTELPDRTDGSNGVHRHGSSVTFPNQTWTASNYRVDAVFSTTP